MATRYPARLFLYGSNDYARADVGNRGDTRHRNDRSDVEGPPLGTTFEFSTDFYRHSAPYAKFLSYGPPKDGIPAINGPVFMPVLAATEWLKPKESVVVVRRSWDVQAYPVRVLMWHELVNDFVGCIPSTVSYCRYATPPLLTTDVWLE